MYVCVYIYIERESSCFAGSGTGGSGDLVSSQAAAAGGNEAAGSSPSEVAIMKKAAAAGSSGVTTKKAAAGGSPGVAAKKAAGGSVKGAADVSKSPMADRAEAKGRRPATPQKAALTHDATAAAESSLLRASSVTGLVDPDEVSVPATQPSPGQTPVKSPAPKKSRVDGEAGSGDEDTVIETALEPDNGAAVKEERGTSLDSLPTLMLDDCHPKELFAETGPKPPDAEADEHERAKFGVVTPAGRTRTWLYSSPAFEMLQCLVYEKKDMEDLPNMDQWPKGLPKDPLEQMFLWKRQDFDMPPPWFIKASDPEHQLKNSTLELLSNVAHDLIVDVWAMVDKRAGMVERFSKIKVTITKMEEEKMGALDVDAESFGRESKAILDWGAGQRMRMDKEIKILEAKLEQEGTQSIHEIARLLSYLAECGEHVEVFDGERLLLDALDKALDSQVQEIIADELESATPVPKDFPASSESVPATPVPSAPAAVIKTPEARGPRKLPDQILHCRFITLYVWFINIYIYIHMYVWCMFDYICFII